MKLNYKAFGAGESLFILHGLMGMLDNWQVQAKTLQDNFHVIIVDLRNHGHSPHDPDHSYEAMVEDILELMDDMKIQKAHFLGHSMGGKVVMKLAQEHPERVNKLIVADIGPKAYPVHHEKILQALRSVPLNQISKRSEAETFLAALIPESGVRQFLMKSLYHPDKDSFAWRFNLDAIEKNIAQVGVPMDELDYEGETLFIRGGDSNYILDQDWADIKLIFPNSYLVTIEGAGHWLHAEKPREFAQIVLDFLMN